ncbi:MAG: mechanosensitive ion channel, partial [Akkermansiaceae bacterium]|nr:mechanosensitive ion channel [Akkermansiaceae bacterium]
MVIGLVVAGLLSVVGQEASPPATTPGESGLSIEAVEDRLKEIEGNPDLDDEAKKALADGYRQALDALKQTGQFRALEKEYRRTLEDGAEETRRIRAEIETLKDADPASQLPDGINGKSTNSQLDGALSQLQSELSAHKVELASLEDELTALQTRVGKIDDRSSAAAGELAAIVSKLETVGEADEASDPMKQAEQATLEAGRAQLQAEIAMLEQESLSGGIRLPHQEAARDLAEMKMVATEKRIAMVRDLVAAVLADKLGSTESMVADVRRKNPQVAPALDKFLTEVSGLIAEARQVEGSIESCGRLAAEREAELNRIASGFDELEQQLDLGALEGSLAQGLLDHLRTLPTERDSQRRLAKISSQMKEARNGLFELNRSIREQTRPTKSESGGGAEPDEGVGGDAGTEIAALQETWKTLRQDLRASYGRWIRNLGQLDRAERGIQAKSHSFRDFSTEKLLLVRTSPAIGLQTFRSLPGGFRYCYGIDRISELGERLAALPLVFDLVVVALTAAFLGCRRLFKRWLRESSQRTRRISSDRYFHTVVAFLMTLLLAAPPALATALLGWALMFQPDSSQWSSGLGEGLLAVALFLLEAGFLIALCRKEGLGEGHFRWNPAMLRRVRRFTWWLILAYVPTAITQHLVLAEAGVSHLDGLGRLAGLAMVLALGMVVALMMHPEDGVGALIHRHSPRSLFGRLRKLWFGLIVLLSVFLVVLLVSGFLFAGLLLADAIMKSMVLAGGAFVVYGLILRWFSIRERKLALKEILRDRRTRQQAALKEQVEGEKLPVSSADEAPMPEVEEVEIDLATVGEQTRSLVGFLVGVGLLLRLVDVWSEFEPIVDFLRSSSVFGLFSIADLAVIALVVSVVIATLRNLPGLLELLILRRLGLDAGTRNSIVTLANYAVIATAAVFLFQTLGVDWSQFGWIAAALSFGLGFGLQEVVANFVCGIILLFERPVRVGDIVTVDGIDGVVSRIQIRATTITNWDRKEFVVPNKQFVTGTVLNWTLSSSVNRILIVVGVAYGSDTEKARQILLD